MAARESVQQDGELIVRIVQDAQLYLTEMSKVISSTYQRCVTLAGMFTSASTAIFGVLLAYLASDSDPKDPRLVSAAAAAAVLFTVASACCIFAARPVDWRLAGNQPKSLQKDLAAKRPLVEVLRDECQNYQRYIEQNLAAMRKSSRLLKWGATIGIFAPIVGIVIFFATACFS